MSVLRRPARNRTAAILTVFGLVAGLYALLGSAAAGAAQISGAITNVAVSPTQLGAGDGFRTTMDFAVPTGAKSGDTIVLNLDPIYRNVPSPFNVTDPQGNVIATAVTAGNPPVVTFTLSDYVDTHQNVTGNAFFDATISSSATKGEYTIVNTEAGGKEFDIPITITGTAVNRAVPIKYGDFTDAQDQGRTHPTDFLIWSLESKSGPFSSGTVVDTVVAPQLIDCSTAKVFKGTANANGQFVVTSDITAQSTVSCTPANITASYGAAAPGEIIRVQFTVSLPAGTGATTPATTFRNSAQFTTTTDGNTSSNTASSEITQSDAGGAGQGALITIVKKDSNGNDADTAATAPTLPDGTASLNYTITNTGAEDLNNVTVSDTVVSNGTVTGLTCDFSALGGPTTGITWVGPFHPNDSFPCTASLTGVVVSPTVHEDIGSVTGTGAVSGKPVTATNPYHAKTLPKPSIVIVKKDAAGNDADTADAAVTLPDGSTSLVYTVTNDGNEPVTNVAVTDTVVSNGTVTGLTCDFSALGGPASGTTWPGPLPVGASFQCKAELSGVVSGSDHEDVGTVTGTGQVSGTPVTSTNPYHAVTPPPAPAITQTHIDTAVPASSGPSDTLALANTGPSDTYVLLITAGLLLLTGAGLHLAGRRRLDRP